MTEKLRINFACWIYDRMEPLRDGRISPEGISLNYIPLWVSETFYRMGRHREFDVSEMSFGEFIHVISNEKEPSMIALPVFPSRMFRHRSIYINRNSGIEKPSDLKGKRIGILRYAQTASIWIRGILDEHYGVPIDSVEYHVGPLERSSSEAREGGSLFGSAEDIHNPGIRTQAIGRDECLSEMLQRGEIDALYSSREPATLNMPDSNVRRLFADYRHEELSYFMKTGVFPMMHTVAMKMPIYRENPWIAESLLKAFNQSKNQAQKDLEINGVLKNMFPWMVEELAKWKSAIGEDYWPYGVSSNSSAISAFLRYCYLQGITKRELTAEDVFAKEAIAPFKKEKFMP